MRDNLQKLEQIVKDVFDDNSITLTEDTNICELPNWDSFSHISFMAAVQDEFHVNFSVEEIAIISKVKDILEKIKS